jgi:hypothetical protein
MSDPAYLADLKQYARAQYGELTDTDAVVADFDNESDRGAIILAATSIEDSLEHALTRWMVALTADADMEAKARIFGPEGIIGTYANKTWIAYALGIINKDARKEIDLVRHIRNACAHSRKPLSLQLPILAAAIKAAIGQKALDQLKDQEPRTLRTAFISHCAALSFYVITGRRLAPLEILEGMQSGAISPRPPPSSLGK